MSDCASLGCQASGSFTLSRRLPTEGGRAWAQQQAPPLPAPGSAEQREAPRKACLAGLGEEGCPEGFWKEVCRHHTPIPVTSTAVAFKGIVQRVGSGRVVWGARSHGPPG